MGGTAQTKQIGSPNIALQQMFVARAAATSCGDPAAAAADTHVDSGADDHAHAHVDADPAASTMLVKMLQNASECFNASKYCCYYCTTLFWTPKRQFF